MSEIRLNQAFDAGISIILPGPLSLQSLPLLLLSYFLDFPWGPFVKLHLMDPGPEGTVNGILPGPPELVLHALSYDQIWHPPHSFLIIFDNGLYPTELPSDILSLPVSDDLTGDPLQGPLPLGLLVLLLISHDYFVFPSHPLS